MTSLYQPTKHIHQLEESAGSRSCSVFIYACHVCMTSQMFPSHEEHPVLIECRQSAGAQALTEQSYEEIMGL